MGRVTGAQWIERELRRRVDHGDPLTFDGADLNTIDLSGLHIRRGSFVGASLRGASLRGATLVQVDLTGADLSGADLSGATVNMCALGGARLTTTNARRSSWRQCDLGGAYADSTMLRGATLDGCDLRSADLTAADLVAATLNACQFADANLGSANLRWVTSTGCDFSRVEFRGARRFFMCRDLVAEILDRHFGRGIERRAALGMMRGETRWCYREWRDYLTDHPDLFAVAQSVFELYPTSGCAEALAAGWNYPDRLAASSGEPLYDPEQHDSI